MWVPIVRTYEQDFVAAWYATSLIPKTVVIGLGAQHLIAVPLIIVAGMVLIAVMVEYLFLGRLRALQWKSLVQPPTPYSFTSKRSEGEGREMASKTRTPYLSLGTYFRRFLSRLGIDWYLCCGASTLTSPIPYKSLDGDGATF